MKTTSQPMKLFFTRDIFVLQCGYEKRTIAKDAGFRWDAQRKVWYTPDVAVAGKLREYGTEQAKNKINRVLLTQTPWTSPLLIPQGLNLLDHQPEAIRFALERNRSYLGLDPGLGKTICAAVIAATLGEPVVYICPPFLTRTVEEEFKKWMPNARIGRYDKGIPLDLPRVLIVPDSIIHRPGVAKDIASFVVGNKNAVVFADEAHRYKNSEAKRTRALFGDKPRDKPEIPGIIDIFKRQVFMSGTPMPNRPKELYPILSKAAPETIDFMNFFKYGMKYCGGFRDAYGYDFDGASNVKELASRVIAPTGNFMIRQKKAILKLPPKLEEVFVVNEDMDAKLMSMNMRIEKQYSSVDDVIKHQIARTENKSPDELHVATYRRHLGAAKVRSAVEYIHSILEETEENILVFAFHKDTISAISHHLSEFAPVIVDGDTPVSARHDIVKDFQADKSKRLIIGNYIALGIGFTITKATRVIFVEFSWVPGENDQASDRAHRIGQNSPVLVQYMVYQNSIDKAVIETLLRKRKSTDLI